MNSRRAGKLMIKLDINSNKLNVPCERCGYTTIIDISRIKKLEIDSFCNKLKTTVIK